MKKTYRFTVLLLMLAAGCGQPQQETPAFFTGEIEYAYTYGSDSLNLDSLVKTRPSRGFFRYDTTGYQSRFTGPDTATYYYSGLLNKAVFISGDDRGCEDYRTAADSVLSVSTYDTEEKILGYSCKVAELKKTRSSVRYYYTPELVMAPATYTRHRAYNWDRYGKEAGGGLVLKLEHRFGVFTMTGTAQKVLAGGKDFQALQIPPDTLAALCRDGH